MPSEPQQGRRGHFRGRRGGDRHGSDRARGSRPAQRDKGSRPANTLDVDQIVGELRARIATQKGVELSNTQIEELAARRLEAILAPRAADAALLDALRQSAGSTGTAVPRPEPLPTYAFGDDILYDSGNGFVRLVRRLLRPFLRLLFDPDPLVSGLGTQTRINAELAAREQRGSARQAEWNALHFELVKRVVTENARASLDVQNLAAQIEALSAKIDFNERRVRGNRGHGPPGATAAPESGSGCRAGAGGGRGQRGHRGWSAAAAAAPPAEQRRGHGRGPLAPGDRDAAGTNSLSRSRRSRRPSQIAHRRPRSPRSLHRPASRYGSPPTRRLTAAPYSSRRATRRAPCLPRRMSAPGPASRNGPRPNPAGTPAGRRGARSSALRRRTKTCRTREAGLDLTPVRRRDRCRARARVPALRRATRAPPRRRCPHHVCARRAHLAERVLRRCRPGAWRTRAAIRGQPDGRRE